MAVVSVALRSFLVGFRFFDISTRVATLYLISPNVIVIWLNRDACSTVSSGDLRQQTECVRARFWWICLIGVTHFSSLAPMVVVVFGQLLHARYAYDEDRAKSMISSIDLNQLRSLHAYRERLYPVLAKDEDAQICLRRRVMCLLSRQVGGPMQMGLLFWGV